MANEIYHQSNWGSPKKDDWGDSYFNPSATNKLYTRSDNYENVEGTDKALASKPDTQSVLMTPTAYSVGSMNSILPPSEVLSELVANGDFATDSDWTIITGTSISGGSANINESGAGSVQLMYNSSSVTANTFYKISFEIKNYISGTCALSLAGYGFQITATANGLFTAYATSVASGSVKIYSSSGFVGSIDNVSVKEVINADFTFDRNSTATRVNKEGLIETVAIDTPRLDYPFINGVVQSEPSLLLEPARTNLILNSEPTATENAASGLTYEAFSWSIGFSNCVKVPTAAADAYWYGGTVLASTTYTLSVYVIMDDLSQPQAGGGAGDDFFMVVGNNASGGSYYYEYFGNNVWKVIHTIVSGTNNLGNNGIRRLPPSASGKGFRATGFQLELASYPTSYIPTSGSAVTRAAETASGAGTSDDFNDSEGVLYAEIAALADDSTDRYILLSDGGWNNRVQLNFENVSNTIEARFFVNAIPQFDTSFLLTDITTFSKFAIKWKVNDFALWVNGVEVSTDTNGSVPSANTFNELSFYDGQGSNPFYGKVKELATFKEALTDTELEALTSWDSFNDMATGQEYSIR